MLSGLNGPSWLAASIWSEFKITDSCGFWSSGSLFGSKRSR